MTRSPFGDSSRFSGSQSGQSWSKGDRVVHPARPEWGSGEILQADAINHNGKPCQRLVIRFQRAGLKTISTAYAELDRAGQALGATAPDPEHDPLAASAAAFSTEEAMLKLPDAATDPFRPLRKRVEANLAVYKYGESSSGLLDWAAIQTGLKDPLTRFNRHELEQWFERFRIEADNHLKKLLRELRKQEPKAIDEIAATATSPGVKRALRQADMGR
jgi:hypothetical protein